MAKPPEDTIFEERQDFMVSPAGGIPTLRTAHFLKPTEKSINGPVLTLPSLPLSWESAWPLKFSFNGWRNPQRKWRTWVTRLHSPYQNTWKRAGIYEALMSSIYRFPRNNGLVVGIAERWCSETNTFVFPWGETTITLEDMMVLFGFSVLGSSALIPFDSKELINIEENLHRAKKFIIRKSNAHKATHGEWLNYFMETGNEFEHEAFLCLWLSRFVLPGNVVGTINIHAFKIATYLSRGVRIALAPTVLANLYRDLGLLRETIKLAKFDESSCLALSLWSPLQFVQIWAWERFPSLQPKFLTIPSGEPRLARWHGAKGPKIGNVRWVLDSAGDSFLWRPYAISVDNWKFPKFYTEKEQWVVFSDHGLDEELESFVRCLRQSDLVGTDSVESYFPHRVAMQFGMDQDLPKWIPHSNATPEIAWKYYTEPIADAKIYLPSRLFESDVSARYLEWWRKSVLHPTCQISGVVTRKRSRVKKLLQRSDGTRQGNYSDFPPGFHPKSNWGKGTLRIFNHCSSEDRRANKVEPFSAIKKEDNCFSSPNYGNRDFVTRKKMRGPMEMTGRKMKAFNEIENGKKTKMKRSVQNVVCIKHEEEDNGHFSAKFSEFELEYRIRKLERVVAAIKTAKFGCRAVKQESYQC